MPTVLQQTQMLNEKNQLQLQQQIKAVQQQQQQMPQQQIILQQVSY